MYKTTIISSKDSGSVSSGTPGYYIFDITPESGGSYIFRATIYTVSNSGTVNWYKNNTSQNVDDILPEPREHSYIMTSSGSDNFKMGMYSAKSRVYFENAFVEKINATLKGYKGLYGDPTLLSDIGELATVNIFGIDKNGIFKGGLLQEKSNEATTGSVTLGNAKGYIRVLFNGEYVKIPYYGD